MPPLHLVNPCLVPNVNSQCLVPQFIPPLSRLLFQCRYSGSAAKALVMEVNDVPPPLPVAAAGPLRVELRLGNGQCHTKGCVEEVAAYSSYYSPSDYPITKVLRDPVYVEVRILERSDPNVVLTLEHCWATSSPNPDSLPQWDLVLNGCPYSEDHYMTKVLPVEAYSGLSYPTHYKRFIVKMFTFVDQTTYSPYQNTQYAIPAAWTPVNHSATGKREKLQPMFPRAKERLCQAGN
ncbi:hypothetical protein WMY93_001354 [Mugilogobius chulae]|uniref:ZP domain-containing protein n=1 Tax=Mugilogobius chulae TaxID=88201 RepID=A0AAW0Q3J5_9GOBI